MTYLALGDVEAVKGVLADIEAAVGRASPLYARLDYWYQLALGNYGVAIGILESLPAQLQGMPQVSWAYATAYVLSGDYQSARDYAFKFRPVFADRDLWQQELKNSEMPECEMAGAIFETGDDIGRDLLQLFIRNYETRLSNKEPGEGRSQRIIVCYLVAGRYETALDIVDRESAQGRLLDWWWHHRMLPWWAPLEDNPRYRELVDRIDGLLDQQRALLN